MQLCLTKLRVILEIDPYVMSLHFFFNERIIAASPKFKGMSAKNDSVLQIEELVRIYYSIWIEIYIYASRIFLEPKFVYH